MFFPKIGNVQTNNDEALNSNSLLQEGRSYHLGSSKVPHLLPPPGKLKPYADRVAGEMETWPAHSNLLSSSQAKSASKPTFLQKLEAYLYRELRILGCPNIATPSEKRLQAFREVFEYLIDDFRTYKPLLSSIKQEYENMITSQKETIKSLEPLKAMLVNVNDQCEQKILDLKMDDKKDLVVAKKRNAELNNNIISLKEEILSLKQQIKKCQDEVEHVYKKYRDESDSRKLLIQSMNDLKYQSENSSKAMSSSENEAGEKGDCVLLRIALKKAREDLNNKTFKLSEVLADYGDVVPRRDFEKMEAQFSKMEEEFASLKSSNEVLMKEHSTLLDIHQKVIEQREDFASECEKMRRSATPRPDWDRCGLYIEGGPERWSELSAEKNSSDKVDILLAEMTGQDISVIKSGGGIVDFFEPKGVGEDIPAYLRSSEKVRNRRLSKRDLSVMIKDIWKEKMKVEGNLPFTDHSSMKDYLYKYLKQCFTTDDMVIEFGYNMHDALTRYSVDPNIGLFNGMITGDLDEDIYYSNLSQLEGLYHVFSQADNDEQGLSKKEFQNCISTYFPSFTTDDLSDILKSAEKELRATDQDIIPYKDLFTEDDEGKTGPFITLIQELLKLDKEKYLKEIEKQLESREEISREDLSEALLKLNSKMNRELCDSYVKLGYRNNDLDTLDLPSLMKNLRRSCIRRT